MDSVGTVVRSAHDPTVPATMGRPAERGPGNDEAAGRPAAFVQLVSASGDGQCAQPRGAPSSSAVRKLEPQPHAATALGLFTVKPAPIRVST